MLGRLARELPLVGVAYEPNGMDSAAWRSAPRTASAARASGVSTSSGSRTTRRARWSKLHAPARYAFTAADGPRRLDAAGDPFAPSPTLRQRLTPGAGS
jgi:hypothetical protein